jgi:hypothetical protein
VHQTNFEEGPFLKSSQLSVASIVCMMIVFSLRAFAAKNYLTIVDPQKKDVCQLYLAGPALKPLSLDPNVLVVAANKQVSVEVRGLGGVISEPVDISGLQILNPNFSLHLGPLTYEEAVQVAQNVTAEDGEWRLPTAQELLALRALGYWKTEQIFRLNTVWAAPVSEEEQEKRRDLVWERYRSNSKGMFYAARQMTEMAISQNDREEFALRRAFNIITGREVQLNPREVHTTKFPVLFVRDPR